MSGKRQYKLASKPRSTIRVVRSIWGKDLELMIKSALEEEDFHRYHVVNLGNYYQVDVYAKREYQ